MLYGAIIGDIAGSIYEFDNIKHKPEEIMTDDCFFTDDTVMTVAIAHALISKDTFNFKDKMMAWGNRYPNRGYGAKFNVWLENGGEPYNSFGNGSAMRVSPVAWAFNNINEVASVAELTAIPTHDHPEGIKGAMATATAIYLARTGASKESIVRYIEEEYKYKIQSCDEIRPGYKFNETCQDTVPQAIAAFVDSSDFEDCIKLAISLGGDSDTLAAIAGSIAEAYYGVPEELVKRCRAFLPDQILYTIDTFDSIYKEE